MDLQVVILATEERTAELARQNAERQCDNVVMIHDDRPFYQKLKDVYSINGYKWVIISNGDILFKDGMVQNLYNYAEENQDGIFAAYGIIDCKFLGKRYASPKIYKSAVFPHLEKHVSNVIRPEASAIGKIGNKYGRLHEIDVLTAKHDYDQYYTDIYIKGYLYGIKFFQHVAERRWKMWQKQATHDKDIEVVMKGFKDGSTSKKKIGIDRSMFDKEQILKMLNVEEKQPITI
jgi:hypothetical protein